MGVVSVCVVCCVYLCISTWLFCDFSFRIQTTATDDISTNGKRVLFFNVALPTRRCSAALFYVLNKQCEIACTHKYPLRNVTYITCTHALQRRKNEKERTDTRTHTQSTLYINIPFRQVIRVCILLSLSIFKFQPLKSGCNTENDF